MNPSNETSARAVRRKVTLLMICGLAGAASIGAANASALAGNEAPHISVHYDPQNLKTEEGVKIVYRQIVRAAEVVCPANPASDHFINQAVRQCREESIARAVHAIDNQRLAEVLATHAPRG